MLRKFKLPKSLFKPKSKNILKSRQPTKSFFSLNAKIKYYKSKQTLL